MGKKLTRDMLTTEEILELNKLYTLSNAPVNFLMRLGEKGAFSQEGAKVVWGTLRLNILGPASTVYKARKARDRIPIYEKELKKKYNCDEIDEGKWVIPVDYCPLGF